MISRLFLLTCVAAAVQSSAPQEKRKVGLEHNISVSAVTIAVTVQAPGGKYINNLRREDFTVSENGVKQKITYFKQDSGAPVSLTVLLDVSGSMALQDRLIDSRGALRSLATSILGPQDEVSLLIFADGEVEVASRFSTDKSGFLAELDKLQAYGQTALNDAVAVAPEFGNKGNCEKRALLLITDGIENDSRTTPDQAIELARRVDVPIFSVGYRVPLTEHFLKKYKRRLTLTAGGIVFSLERFSLATGGRMFIAGDSEELVAAFAEIKKEMSYQYLVGYTSYRDPGNTYRRIKVQTSKKRYKVRAREGY
jgi:Ca-activated chloride channel family protein